MNYIRTFTGKAVNLLAPHPDTICIEDIAAGLAAQTRWLGQFGERYPVAAHCVHVSFMVCPELALAGLLHDAAEAYLGDIPSPLKKLLPDYRRIERRFEQVIGEKFGVRLRVPPVVVSDRLALYLERRSLWSFPVMGDVPRPPLPWQTVDWDFQWWTNLSPYAARREFLRRFERLGGPRP